MFEIIIAFLFGILASFLAWLITYRFITPKLSFFPAVYKEKTDENPAGFKYRIRIKNKGFRDIIDMEIIVKLRIKGLYEHKRNIWNAIYIPVDDPRIPKIQSQRKKMKRTAVLLCISKIIPTAKAILPKELQEKCKDNSLLLEDILELGKEANLQIYCFGYDPFSGSRKLFESKLFTIKDIIIE